MRVYVRAMPSESIWRRAAPTILAAAVGAVAGVAGSAYVAYEANGAALVAASLTVLETRDMPPDMRLWATQIIDHYAPIKLPPSVKFPVLYGSGSAGEAESVHGTVTVSPTPPRPQQPRSP